MRKLINIFGVLALFGMFAFGSYTYWESSGSEEVVNVTITQNLEDSGWYWTQFNLPEDGEMSELVGWDEYWETRNFAEMLVSEGIVSGHLYFGNFCCAETISGKYVFLPTDDLNKDVKTLVFFAKDGSIWTIPVPETLLTPNTGEIIVQATVHR